MSKPLFIISAPVDTYSGYGARSRDINFTGEVDTVYLGCWWKDYLLKIGGFDENIFLFFEDDDLSLRLSKSPQALMLIHNAIVKHDGGASSGYSLESEKIKNWNCRCWNPRCIKCFVSSEKRIQCNYF